MWLARLGTDVSYGSIDVHFVLYSWCASHTSTPTACSVLAHLAVWCAIHTLTYLVCAIYTFIVTHHAVPSTPTVCRCASSLVCYTHSFFYGVASLCKVVFASYDSLYTNTTDVSAATNNITGMLLSGDSIS